MPELAEVEFGRKEAESVALGRKISEVWCDDDAIVFAGVEPGKMQSYLQGRTVVGTGRHGKYIWFELDQRPWPLFHFGMTGAFRIKDRDPLEIEASPKTPDRSWPPRFAKICLTFEDGGELVMTNARRLGRIRLLEDPVAEAPIDKLGFDPYLSMPSAEDFAREVLRRKVTIKGLLLNQSFAAGVGNWIADEVLYQAGIDPRRRGCDLSTAEVLDLQTSLQNIVNTAVQVDADKARFPISWLFHERWGKKADAKIDGEVIEHMTVAGRTTAWVPTRQK